MGNLRLYAVRTFHPAAHGCQLWQSYNVEDSSHSQGLTTLTKWTSPPEIPSLKYSCP